MTRLPELPTFISLGAGVQSTTLYLMACHGKFDTCPQAAIFADTGWEPKGVYAHLNWLQGLHLPIPIEVVSAGNIRNETLAALSGQRFASLPFYAYNENGEKSMLQRQCTKEYKIAPVRNAIKRRLGIRRGGGSPVANLWLGISLDEVQRMKAADVRWLIHRWPLIEKRMSRENCLRWLAAHGYPTPPKSACIGCPFHSKRLWRDMKENDPESWADAENDPESWADAVDFDRTIRQGAMGRLKTLT